MIYVALGEGRDRSAPRRGTVIALNARILRVGDTGGCSLAKRIKIRCATPHQQRSPALDFAQAGSRERPASACAPTSLSAGASDEPKQEGQASSFELHHLSLHLVSGRSRPSVSSADT